MPTMIPDATKRPSIICDLDGTLCLFNGRGPFDFHLCGTDLPNAPVLAAVRAFQQAGYALLLVTGRFERYRDQTLDWLIRHRLEFGALFMRADGDYRKDAEIKPELYHEHIEPHYNVLLSLDDRDQSVACWRALGVPCFQVAPGGF